MDDFIPSENLSGVEQLELPAIDHSIGTQNVSRLRRELENEPDEFRRLRLLKLLVYEAEKSQREQSDRMDRHMAELEELTYRQVELVEKGKLKGQIIRPAKLLALLKDLMSNYQTLRRRISPLAK